MSISNTLPLSLLALTTGALAIGCGETISAPDDDRWNERGGYVSVLHARTITARADTSVLTVTAGFFPPGREGEGVEVERVEFRGMPLGWARTQNGVYYGLSTDSVEYPGVYEATPQTIAVWGGNGVPSLRDSVIAPRLLGWRGPWPADTLRRDRDLVMRWTPDTLWDGDVYVFVEMERYGRPAQMMSFIHDDGVHVIPAEVLRAAGRKVLVTIQKSNSAHRRLTDDRQLYLEAGSEVRIEYLLE